MSNLLNCSKDTLLIIIEFCNYDDMIELKNTCKQLHKLYTLLFNKLQALQQVFTNNICENSEINKKFDKYNKYLKHPYNNYLKQPYNNYLKQPYNNYLKQPYNNYLKQPYNNYLKHPYNKYLKQPYSEYLKRPYSEYFTLLDYARKRLRNIRINEIPYRLSYNNIEPAYIDITTNNYTNLLHATLQFTGILGSFSGLYGVAREHIIYIKLDGVFFEDFKLLHRNNDRYLIDINYARVLLSNEIHTPPLYNDYMIVKEFSIQGFIGRMHFYLYNRNTLYDKKLNIYPCILFHNYGSAEINYITTNWIVIKHKYNPIKKVVIVFHTNDNKLNITFNSSKYFDIMWNCHTNKKRPLDTIVINLKKEIIETKVKNIDIYVNDKYYLDDCCVYYNNINIAISSEGQWAHLIN